MPVSSKASNIFEDSLDSCLYVAPGTILKIASVDSKIIFAKVLGSMPQMKENKGLLLRLSNAAAAYLGMVDAKFPVQVSFYQ